MQGENARPFAPGRGPYGYGKSGVPLATEFCRCRLLAGSPRYLHQETRAGSFPGEGPGAVGVLAALGQKESPGVSGA